MRLIHTSDWHIGASKFLPDYLERQGNVIDEIFTIAKRLNIDTVVVAGDIFDTEEPTAEERDLVQRKLIGYDKAGFKILVIPGNHDMANMTGYTAIHYLALLHDQGKFINSTVVERTTYRVIDDTLFILVCHTPRKFKEDCEKAIQDAKEASITIPYKNVVVVVHETIKGSITDTNWRIKGGVDVPKLDYEGEDAQEFDITYCALGDIHICFPPETNVMTDYNKCSNLHDIVTDPTITHVLSYNLEEKRIERKKITEKRKSEFKGKYTTVTLCDGSSLKSTEDHKYIVVGRGEVPANEIKAGDKLIQYAGEFSQIYKCKECKEEFLTRHQRAIHERNHIVHNCIECKKTFESFAAYAAHFQVDHQNKFTTKMDYIKCHLCGELHREKNMGAHLFFHNTERVIQRSTKSIESLKKYYQTPEGIEERNKKRERQTGKKYFAEYLSKHSELLVNRPKTKPELIVDGFGITGLTYTGNGAFYTALRCPNGRIWNKNPDFVVGNPKNRKEISKVVEIFGGMNYFHTYEEVDFLKYLYKEAGIEALIITQDKLTTLKNREITKAELQAFCNNHYIEVENVHTNIRETKTTQFVYSIEVEDNYNFFAVAGDYEYSGTGPNTKKARLGTQYPKTPILVKNCQKMAPRTYYCGAPLQVKFGDQWPKGVLIVDTEDPDNPVFEPVSSKQMVKANSFENLPEDCYVKVVVNKTDSLGVVRPDNVMRVEFEKPTFEPVLDLKKGLSLHQLIVEGVSQTLEGDELAIAKREIDNIIKQVGQIDE